MQNRPCDALICIPIINRKEKIRLIDNIENGGRVTQAIVLKSREKQPKVAS